MEGPIQSVGALRDGLRTAMYPVTENLYPVLARWLGAVWLGEGDVVAYLLGSPCCLLTGWEDLVGEPCRVVLAESSSYTALTYACVHTSRSAI